MSTPAFKQEHLGHWTKPDPAPKPGDILTHIASGMTHRIVAIGEDRGDGRHVCLLGENLKLVFPQGGWQIDRAPAQMTQADYEKCFPAEHGFETIPTA